MKLRRRRSAALTVSLLVAPALALAACGGSSDPAAPSATPSAAASSSSTGVTVKGAFGEKPTVEVPAKSAPTALAVDVLKQGEGDAAAKGDLVVVNYLGQTWEPKDGKPNIFDNSFDKKQAFGFALGAGKVIPGWDQGVEGKKVGSRLLLTIPPKLAYGEEKSAQNELGGQALVFVVDLVDTIGKDASATGTKVEATTAGLPKITSEPGKKPAVTSVAGVKPPAQPLSALLVKGDGDKIDPARTLALQIVQTDTATGKQSQETWGKGLESVPAQQVLTTIPALKDAPVGSRAVLVTPAAAGGQPSVVLVGDVVGQY